MMDVTECVGERILASLRETCKAWLAHKASLCHIPTNVSVAANNDDFLGHDMVLNDFEMAGSVVG